MIVYAEADYKRNNPLGFPSITFFDRLHKRFHCANFRYVLDEKFNNANCVVQCVRKLELLVTKPAALMDFVLTSESVELDRRLNIRYGFLH